MAEIKPFRGFIYNLEKIKDVSNVISPPWDLINEELERKLLSLSEWNVVKLIAKEHLPEEVYENFNFWIKNKILVQDNKECFYFLKGIFEYGGRKYKREGIFCILKIEDFDSKKVIPHEKIFSKYAYNRYKLLEKCRANFCPIYMLYQDKSFEIEKIIEKNQTFYTGRMNDETFEFGKIEDKEKIENIRKVLKEKVIFIADGHHRYIASLMFYKNNPDERNKYVFIYLSNIESEGVLILPTHRYIPSDVKLKFSEKLIKIIKVKDIEEMEKNMKNEKKKRYIGMFYRDEFYIVDLSEYENNIECDALYKKLDTFIVDNYLIKNFIEIEEDVEFSYHTSKEYLLKEYEKRKRGVIFFLNPVDKNLFIEICLKGKIMPHKSTYFYPKVPSGLVIYKF